MSLKRVLICLCLDVEVDEFIKSMFSLIHEYLKGQRGTSSKILNFQLPAELEKKIDFEIQKSPESFEELLSLSEKIVQNSVNTGHRRFFNQLFSQMDPIATMAELLSCVMNTSIYTFEVAPVFSLMEEHLLKEILNLVGFGTGDGIFAPGGSFANLYGMLCARQRKFPDVKTKGMCAVGKPIVAFTSELSHYSIKKMGICMGIGLENIIAVDADNSGKMIPADLEAKIKKAIAEDKIPFFVNATAGTTVMGSFDPFHEVSAICKKYDVWMHVDACWGGSVFVSKKHRSLGSGVEKADSLAWCFHKMLGVPLQCSALVLKDRDLLSQTSNIRASYLFQQDKVYPAELDTGDKALQCSRKTDCFKLWLTWKALGSDHMGDRVDKAFENAKYLRDQVVERKGFKLLHEPECTNICFWFIPENVPQDRLDRVAPYIKGKMQMSGTIMVGYQPLRNLPNFFRMIFTSSNVTRNDVDFLLNEIQKYGNEFSQL